MGKIHFHDGRSGPNQCFVIFETGEKFMPNEQIEKAFTYHAPKNDQAVRYTELRDKAKELALLIDKECPNSREKSLALTNLEQAIMWGNASIARNE